MTDRDNPPSREDVAARLAAVAAQREAERAEQQNRQAANAARGIGFRIAIELVAAIAVGTAMGYGLDSWFDTAPVFLVVMIVLGFCAFLMNVFRIMKGLDQSVGLGRAMREADTPGHDGRHGNGA
ncbi:MAG: AtpZ/AtpI family protein [Rhodobacteraceae bacterium]|nr:AtpZ/AtpI family protein [Paracoccaceae bacterium]